MATKATTKSTASAPRKQPARKLQDNFTFLVVYPNRLARLVTVYELKWLWEVQLNLVMASHEIDIDNPKKDVGYIYSTNELGRERAIAHWKGYDWDFDVDQRCEVAGGLVNLDKCRFPLLQISYQIEPEYGRSSSFEKAIKKCEELRKAA